ncbi:MAG: hypothetical protein Q8N56_03360 [bacterium]|nr:hypothetical protein [bacterium]
MAEEQNKNLSRADLVKKAQQATLRMAKEWQRSEGTTHHAIKSYEDVVQIDPDSQEADEARSALLKVAEDWEKKGQKYAAARLYKELMTYKNN